MKKDYAVVRTEDATIPDDEYARALWTKLWRERGFAAHEEVARSESYRVILPYLTAVPRGVRVLDGGCGTGGWTLFLRKIGYEAVGLDISSEAIDHLRSAFPDGEWVCGDVRRTPFPAASFDAYCSWGTFEHFESGPGDCIDEANRILRPGGSLFISVPYQNWRHIVRDSGPLHRWDETFDPEVGYRHAHRFYQWRFTGPEIARELELRGFRVLAIRPIDKLEGARRAIQWDFSFVPRRARSLVARGMALVAPAPSIAHMLVAVARKRVNTGRAGAP